MATTMERMANGFKTYRHRDTGVVFKFPVNAARHFKNLEEVSEGTKPFAYTPIPEETVAELRGSATESIEAEPTRASAKKGK